MQRGEAALQPPDHLIEGDRQPSQLVLFHRDGEPAVQAAAVGDGADLFDDPVDRLEGAPRDERPHQDGERDARNQDEQ